MRPWEVTPRGSDLTIEARGRDLGTLFSNAAMGLISVYEHRGKVRNHETVSVRIHSSSAESMMVHWLSELVYIIQVRRWLYTKVEFTRLHENHLTAVLHGQAMQEDLHELAREVKAVTFYQLSITRDKDQLKAHVVLDL